MAFVLIQNGIVIQKQPDADDGFIEAPDTVVCGQLFDGADFSNPLPPTPTPDDVWAEKDRRWSLGFDYDFGDARGVHHIGTSEKDMMDWQKVQALATAATQLGQPDTPIYIVTDTGAVTIKASEWWPIVLATSAFQQPIFRGAATLVAMDPIPDDYTTNDTYWTSAT